MASDLAVRRQTTGFVHGDGIMGRMRVMCASTAGAGHFSPLVPWIDHLVGLGHQVLVVGPPALEAAAASYDFHPGETADPGEVGALMGRAMSMRHEDVAQMVVGEVFARLNSGALVPAMRAAMAEFRPDVVLRDPTEFASALCAAEADIRQVRIGHGLASSEAGLLRHAAPVLEEWRTGLSEVVAGSAYFTRFPESVDPSPFPATWRYRELTAHTNPRAPAAGKHLVYVTLGTVTPTIPVLLPWYSVLLEALQGLPVDALVTTGYDLEPADLGPVPANVEVTQWVDQRTVMARASVVVHHGGSGTVLSSLESASPQLVVPLFADQSDNAAMVGRERLGLAVADVAPDGPAAMRRPRPGDAQRIREGVGQLLTDEDTHLRTREVARQMSLLPTLTQMSLERGNSG